MKEPLYQYILAPGPVQNLAARPMRRIMIVGHPPCVHLSALLASHNILAEFRDAPPPAAEPPSVVHIIEHPKENTRLEPLSLPKPTGKTPHWYEPCLKPRRKRSK